MSDVSNSLYGLARKLYKAGSINHQEGILLKKAAETIEDLEERVSIMMDGCGISEEKYQQMKIEITRK